MRPSWFPRSPFPVPRSHGLWSPLPSRAWLVVALLTLLAACSSAPTVPVSTPLPATRLTVSGDPGLGPLVRDLGDRYRRQRPHVSVEPREGNSTSALQEFMSGTSDFALLTRPPKQEDLTRANAQSVELGRQGIAIIVNPDNSLRELSKAQLAQVFSGQVSEWARLGARLPTGASPIIAVVSRESGSGTRQVFESLVMDKTRVTTTALIQPSEHNVVDYVAAQPDAIGYVSFNSLLPRVRALTLEGVSPTLVNIASGKYPLPQSVFLIAPARPSPEAATFLQFLDSDPARQVLQKYMVPKAAQ